MKILIVYAHPEPTSLNGSLKDLAVKVLKEEGHEVIVSDLYQMKWKAAADGDDFLSRGSERLSYIQDSKDAFLTGTLTADIQEEIRKLLWSDAVVFQFPLWWFSMPAILKGWFDRVYVNGFENKTPGTMTANKYSNRASDKECQEQVFTCFSQENLASNSR